MDVQTLLIIQFFLLVALMLGLIWWVRKSIASLPAQLEAGLEAKQDGLLRRMLIDLNDGLGKQGDRITASQLDAADRLRASVSDELGKMQAAIKTLELELQQKQDALKAAMLGGMLEKLAEQSGAQQELIQSTLRHTTLQINATIENLTKSTDARLHEIGSKVNERLDEGFKKTNDTFVNVMTRLATIDEAQKKIDGLTTNVVSLQQLLGDKRSRGAFGEVQLEALVHNVMPVGSFEMQATLSNKARADCVLNLPAPTGRVVVDSKFPLENYHRMFNDNLTEVEHNVAQGLFKSDVKKHINDIADKYILAGETSDGAMMFVPAEAVFAEIHAHHPEVVEYGYQRRVWIVSPTTLMAVLNTARAVMRDVETRKQIHIIKDELGKLSKDFSLFDERMKKLATHIDQANRDVVDIQTSSKRITKRFASIEKAELDELQALPDPAADTSPPRLD